MLKIPTGGRQTSWLFTKRGYRKTEIKVVRVGLEPGASRRTVRVPVDDLTTWLRRLGAGIFGIAFYRKLIFCLFFYRSEPE